MKITVTKVFKELEANYGWQNTDKDQEELIKEAIRDTLKVVNEILITHKKITIR